MSDLYSVKMRASREGEHISGAEKIVPSSSVPKTVAQLAERALSHAKGVPDFVNLKIERPGDIIRLPALAVVTNVTKTAAEGRARAAELLRGAGITRIDEIMAKFADSYVMRGAMLLDADTLERLEPDRERGVRATYMDDADSLAKGSASGKNHYAEAIVLATKVQYAPGIVGEICVSDDSDYVTGYVATRDIGYQRITTIKEKGDPAGGRIFLYRGPREGVAETIRFLEKQCVIVENVPTLGGVSAEHRLESLEHEMCAIREAHLERVCRMVDDCRLVLASNDYLDLANDERVKKAAAEAAMKYGAGSTGARLVTGTLKDHVELERHLAAFKQTEAALVWATGYMANVGVISALVKKGDVILSDELNHASIIDGCRLSGADVLVYRHNDMADLERKLAGCREHRRRLVVSDAVFSMDGDMLKLPEFLSICRRHDAFSMIDEAHSTGVIGDRGHGICEHFGCGHPDILMGTLSKALGSEGGYVCGSELLISYLRNRSRSFIFSTAPGAAAMAAANAAISVLESEPGRAYAARENARFLVDELAKLGVEASTESAIVPILVGDEAQALAVSAKLREQGIMVPAIRYPTVARGKARLRAAVKCSHTHEELLMAAEAIAKALNETK